MTGLYFQYLDLLSKRFGLLKEMLPGAARVSIFSDVQSADQLKKVEEVNRTVGLRLQPIFLQNPPYDFVDAFTAAKRNQSDAVFVLESAPISRARAQLAELAERNQLPASFAFREYVQVVSSHTA